MTARVGVVRAGRVDVDGVVIDPPVLITHDRTPLVWEGIERHPDGWRAVATEPGGRLSASLQVTLADRATGGTGAGSVRPNRIDWALRWQTTIVAAFELPIRLLDPTPGDAELFLPAIHDDREARGPGLYPRPDPARGFAVRADRLPQVAVVVAGRTRSIVLVAADESPRPVVTDLLYALAGSVDEQGRLRLAFRYPQAEWGHVADPPGAVYLAKGAVGAGEDRRHRWRAGQRMACVFRLLTVAVPGAHEVRSLPARLCWRGRRSRWGADAEPQACVRSRRGWIERHLWSDTLGQYASPEGAPTAMAGFVEMSLSMAATMARLDLLGLAADHPARGLGALDRWVNEGLTTEGLLMPVRDASGFRLGRRRYDDHAGLAITAERVVECIRPLVEMRAILALLRQAGPDGIDARRGSEYRRAVDGTGSWLLARAGTTGLPAVIHVDDPSSATDGGATAALVALLADLAREAPGEPLDDPRDDPRLAVAVALYERCLRRSFDAGRFGGVTLDAGCPDREGISAALEAALAMFEATAEAGYLTDAGRAVDAILPYVFAYDIRTFGPGTDAAERDIRTLGASVVSPENQQLDPYPVGGALVRHGLMANDPVAVRAGLANVAWCLDGRWAMLTPDGTRQPEQFNHTAWHYNDYFVTRGDLRRGMPLFGRVDSEHGWAQVLPLAAFLELGDVTVDWASGRVASLDHRMRPRVRRTREGLTVAIQPRRAHPNHAAGGLTSGADVPLILRLLRPPRGRDLEVITAGVSMPIPWPRSLVAIAVPSAGSFGLRVVAR